MFLHAIAPEHRTDTVLALWPQTLIDPSLCPILADALQDAGCDAAHILDQLRGPRLVSDEAICSAESATWSGPSSRLWSRSRIRAGSLLGSLSGPRQHSRSWSRTRSGAWSRSWFGTGGHAWSRSRSWVGSRSGSG